MNTIFKRVISLVLCLVLATSCLPIGALATSTVLDAAIFCSDVHGSTSDLSSVMAGVKTSGVTYSSIGFVGDTCLTVANTGSTVKSGLGYTPTVMFSYASSHDTENSADIKNNWNYSGEVENVSDYYLVYTIREDDMKSDTGADDAFTSWYNGLTDAEKKLPIFIMSHRPLHARRNDNAGAAGWYSAISAAAESSDIVFFWAHNHTSESSVDTAAYYVAKDGTETFTVYNGDTVIPNFTYMNAGYINANGQNPARKPVATTVQITADSMIFQDYTTSGKYTNSSYSHNVTVEREFAAPAVTLESIAISGQTEYAIGDALDLTVTASYSDGTTADVTADATLEGFNMAVGGIYTVAASYEGKNATYTIKVNPMTVTEWDDFDMVSVSATAHDLSGLSVTNVYGDPDLSATFDDYMAVSVIPEGIAQGAQITYAIEVFYEIPVDGIVLYHVSDDGETLTPVSYTLSTSDSGGNYLNFTSNLTGIFAYGLVSVPEGYTLHSLKAENKGSADYFVGNNLDVTDLSVIATYTKDGAEDFSRILYIKDDYATTDGYTLSGYDMQVAGAQEVVVTYEDVSDTFAIHVWANSVTASGVTVALDTAGKEYGVTAVNVAESTNAHVADAVANVMSNYVAYDISLVYESGYAATEDTKTVTLPVPEGVTNPVVYYVSDNGYNVVDMKATVSEDGKTVSFTTTHFSTYVVGENTEITVPDEETATGSGTTTTTEEKEVYVLVSTPTAGKQYIIVSSGSAGTGYALKENTTTGTSVTIKAAGNGINAPYIETADKTIMWNTASGMTFQSENGGYYLRYNSGLTFSTRSSTDWTVGANTAYVYSSSRYRYVYNYNNSGTWTTSSSRNTSSSYSVYFYEKQTVTVETTTTVSGTYSIEGKDETVAAITDATVDLTSSLVFTPTSGEATTTVDPEGVTYAVYEGGDPLGVIDRISGNTVTLSGKPGKALVKVSYDVTLTVDGTETTKTVTDYITVTATTPHHYSIQLHLNEGGTLGEEITAPVALKGIQAGDTYSVWAVVKAYASAEDTEGVDIGTLGDALNWKVSDESIATINKDTGVITFTGTNDGTFDVTVAYEGADGKTITDTITISATKSLYVVPGDGTNDFPEYPNEGAVRFDKTATAVGNFSETGIAKVELSMTGVPYGSTTKTDVVIMVDMTASMSDDDVSAAEGAVKELIKSIVYNEENGEYDENIQLFVDVFYSASSDSSFSTEEYLNNVTISNEDELNAAQSKIDFTQSSQGGGTRYNLAMKDVYETLNREGHAEKQFVVFVSDGVPTAYAPLDNGALGTTITGSNSVDSSLADGWFDLTTGAVTSSFKTEYYSYLIKTAGTPIYTVGCNLDALTEPAEVLAHMSSNYSPDGKTSTGETKYSFFCTTSDGITDEVLNIFKGIGTSIKEAATDVVVEDKIGNDYTVNFGLPTNVTANEAGMSEFYIQAVEYTLDANKERTGDPKILENFTFNADGSFKSHTVNGTACSNCSHVTVTNGVITKIDGTYFDYKSDSTGEYLNWESEKISTTELALQYFVHLDNSADAVGSPDEVPAGTYYTNEYATLTYKNYNGKEVQQEFPIPQMTWNGAQVSYVFYLVNGAGQPVNRAGRVVPFAEAVYVTDVYTYSIIWNDLEQSAGLEAKYLAEEKVPDAYALYDDNATYQIHVYEDENEVNLNNHFVIGGDVTDVYNTVTNSWTNANTTYVFNNKSDSTKYYTVGAYVANDGDTSAAEKTISYLCKGDGTVSDVEYNSFEGLTENAFNENMANGVVYYKLVDGKHTRAIRWEENTTYYVLTKASYSCAAGETQWNPGSKPYSGGTKIGDYVYYVDEKGAVYTIVQKTNGTEVEKGFDFHNTTVAFAVVWKPELVEDTVVVDYGLDVVIDVITNDGMAAGVKEVQTTQPNAEINKGTYTRDEVLTTSVDVEINKMKIGTAKVENLNSVRFSLDQTNGMQFTDPAVFYYEADVNYYDSNGILQTTSMYSSVTVIPATTVYYEDDFLTLASFSKGDSGWTQDETSNWIASVQNGVQDQDRPGESKISAALDADNNYGYDSAYETMSTHSLNNSAHITVDAGTRGEATFTFYGTGFDVISTTSNTTGTLTIQVYSGAKATGTAVKTSIVDTYYGMNADGSISQNNPDALYQVPVMKIFGLTYGQYTVKITAGYNAIFDHDNGGSYELYLDAIRIYDPTGNQDDTANDAYLDDGEAWPTYQELRNNIIAASNYTVTENEDGTVTVTGTDLSGAIFIDCNDATTSIADYVSYGPNNELYLAKNQAIAFTVTDTDIADIQLGIKVANGGSVTYEINGDSYTVNTTTDMYYSILDYAKDGNVVTIENVGGGILSLTNIKVTHTEAPATEAGVSLLSMDAENTGVALMMLRRAPVAEDEVPETTVPEVTEPEETEPKETEPKETVPKETEPKETEPKETVPEETEPEETVPKETEPEETVPKETEPEETVPKETEPEETEPETEPTEPEATEPEEDTSEEVTVKKIVEIVKIIVKKLFGWLFG